LTYSSYTGIVNSCVGNAVIDDALSVRHHLQLTSLTADSIQFAQQHLWTLVISVSLLKMELVR